MCGPTNFTMAEHIRNEAVAKEGPLHSEELFILLKTVIQDEASSHDMQFAQRLRDKAIEELVAPLETFVAAAHREPDLAEELDRADEATEAEVDEETPSPDQQRQLLRAHVNLGHPTIGEFCRALRNGRCRRRVVRWVKRYFKCPECEARPMPRTRLGAASLPKCYRFNQVYTGIDTLEVRNPLNRENPIRISHVICHGTRPLSPGRTQAGYDSYRDDVLQYCEFEFWLKHYDAMEVLIMDQGTEFGADFQHLLCQGSRGIWHPVVTDLETPKEEILSVETDTEQLFKMAIRESVQHWKPQRRRPKVNELIDFTFARAPDATDEWDVLDYVARSMTMSFGRQLRLPSSLLEDDFIDPYLIAQDADTRNATKRGYANGSLPMGARVAADRRAMLTASHSRQRYRIWCRFSTLVSIQGHLACGN